MRGACLLTKKGVFDQCRTGENMDERERLVVELLELHFKPQCAHLGRIARRILHTVDGRHSKLVSMCFLSQALDGLLHTDSDMKSDAIVEGVHTLLSGTQHDATKNPASIRLDTDFFRSMFVSESIDVDVDSLLPKWLQAYQSCTHLSDLQKHNAHTFRNMNESTCALVAALVARGLADIKSAELAIAQHTTKPPFTVKALNFSTNSNRCVYTKYKAYCVPISDSFVTSTLPTLHAHIAKGYQESWIQASECNFREMMTALWTRKLLIGLSNDYVDDDWDGSDLRWANRQVSRDAISPLFTKLWTTVERWLPKESTRPWNYATIEEYPSSFEGFATEHEYTRCHSHPEKQSLILKMNLSPSPLKLILRWYRKSPVQSQAYVLNQGEVLILPQEMLSFIEFGIGDLEMDRESTSPVEYGPMLLTLKTMKQVTIYSPERMRTILSNSSAEEPTSHHASTTSSCDKVAHKAIRTVVDAEPIVIRIKGARGRPKMLKVPVMRQLVAVRGRRFTGNPKSKHWFAIVANINEETGVVRVEYVGESSFDEIDDPKDMMFPVTRPLMEKLSKHTNNDLNYHKAWTLALDILDNTHKATDKTTESATDDMVEAPCMRPQYADDTMWSITMQHDDMGNGLYVTSCAKGTLFPYSSHDRDIDHLQPSNTSGDYAITLRSAPTTTHTFLNVDNPYDRGPGAYANASDYRWSKESKELEYIPNPIDYDLEANGQFIEYEGNVYVRALRDMCNEFMMVCYGNGYQEGC